MERFLAMTITVMSVLILGLCSGVLHAQVADVPTSINYQGHLTDADGIDLNAEIQIEVRLYDSLIAGIGKGIGNSHVVYAEMNPLVSVSEGNFLIAIGDGNPLDAKWAGLPHDELIEKENVYLELWINGERLSPRQRMGSVAAVMKAQHAKYADEFITVPIVTDDMMPNYPASRITSGTFKASQIPNLDVSYISENSSLVPAQLPAIPVGKFDELSGNFTAAQLAPIDPDNITTGTLDLDRFPEDVYMSAQTFAISIQHNLGGKTGAYLAIPDGFDGSECKSIFSPTEARPVEGIDRVDMWMNDTGVLYCTVNEKDNNDNSDNTLEDCMVTALTLCKKGGI